MHMAKSLGDLLNRPSRFFDYKILRSRCFIPFSYFPSVPKCCKDSINALTVPLIILSYRSEQSASSSTNQSLRRGRACSISIHNNSSAEQCSALIMSITVLRYIFSLANSSDSISDIFIVDHGVVSSL